MTKCVYLVVGNHCRYLRRDIVKNYLTVCNGNDGGKECAHYIPQPKPLLSVQAELEKNIAKILSLFVEAQKIGIVITEGQAIQIKRVIDSRMDETLNILIASKNPFKLEDK